jgi:Zinc-uptake complex component A periplasmic
MLDALVASTADPWNHSSRDEQRQELADDGDHADEELCDRVVIGRHGTDSWDAAGDDQSGVEAADCGTHPRWRRTGRRRLVEVTNLTSAGSEPHDLELSPAQVDRIDDADLVLYLGAGFQPDQAAA